LYLTITRRLRETLAAYIKEKYGLEIAIPLEKPPKIEMGEAASPVCFELAKRLKRAPRQIAQEIAASLPNVSGVSRIEVAGAGYLNVFLDRAAFWSSLAETRRASRGAEQTAAKKVIVEHTSINPNKAAHIGHVRNAVLGDTIARILRNAGERVQVQNYIDNTGVQVADVVIGFLQIEKKTLAEVRALAKRPGFDYLCWDLYARVTQFYEQDKTQSGTLRAATLHAIEEGKSEAAEMGTVIADAIVGFHLRTMKRLGISYELLARESEILHLKFWEAAFAKLKGAGAIHLATSGKMAGCWIMPAEPTEKREQPARTKENGETQEDEENIQDKIIVRSNGTVTYVGKDIAYQLWKFDLLGKDFHYKRWLDAPADETVWTTTTDANDPAAPHFGEPASRVYNVIDSRQSYLQDVVAQGLRGLGHAKEAANSIHFSYEIVALTPRCARELGYELSGEEAKKPYVEVSGRKGLGVKADDLITKLEEATLSEVQKRHADMSEAEQVATAHAIAVGALRFFLLKFTRNTIIAFDFEDALSFEGETGPYCQYAVVRIRGIRRKGAEAGPGDILPQSSAKFLNGAEGAGLWELLLQAGTLEYAADAAIGAQEPAFLAKYAFQLAQAFNNFYHQHHILSEPDAEKRAFLLALTETVERQLLRALSLLGIEAPERM
jgi:arginyl-tRNA synthetase